MWLFLKFSMKLFVLNGIYSVFMEAQTKIRHGVWEILKQFADNVNSPWCYMGDFNSIAKSSEKLGGSIIFDSHYSEFREMISYSGLLDLGFSGPTYTWSNKRRFQFHIRKRLDRVLSDSQWQLWFPNASIMHMPSVNNDHTPILLNLEKNLLGKKTPFPVWGNVVQTWAFQGSYKIMLEFISLSSSYYKIENY